MKTEVERKNMKSKLVRQVLAASVLLAAPALAAAKPNAMPDPPLTDTQIAQTVQRDLLKYADFTVFDDLSFNVHNGQLTLLGEVTEPFKKADIEKLAAKVPGATGVTDEIQVLPFSDTDNLLRHRVAAMIYRDPSLARYSVGTNSPIHIIVDSGHVTLKGAVITQAGKEDAGLLASSVVPTANNLQVVNALSR